MPGKYQVICGKCNKFCHTATLGVLVEEQYPGGHMVRYYADKKVCPSCGHVLLAGFGAEIHSHDKDFLELGKPDYILT